MKNIKLNILLIVMIMTTSCSQSPSDVQMVKHADWKSVFNAKLPLLGHRNWILVVDKAFPGQSAAGMEFIDSGEDFHPVLKHVLSQIDESTHIKPIYYQDLELEYITESLVPGIDKFNFKSNEMLKSVELNRILHEEIFSKMDEASSLFNVLVIKTENTIPYSSLFIELDCKYWDDERERQLRRMMELDNK